MTFGKNFSLRADFFCPDNGNRHVLSFVDDIVDAKKKRRRRFLL